MFVFLSKKIPMPNEARIHSLCWNTVGGWIACGSEDGMLKVLKLDVSPESKARGVAAPVSIAEVSINVRSVKLT